MVIWKYFSNNGIHYIGMVHSDLYDGLSQLFWYLHQDCNDVANLQALHISNEGVLFAMPVKKTYTTWSMEVSSMLRCVPIFSTSKFQSPA